MGELICPNCGSKVKLPEHSTLCSGITFSKESVGTHYLQMESTTNSLNTKENNTMTNEINNTTNNTINNAKERRTMTAAERLEAMKARGIDTTNYFAMNESTLIKMVDGVPTLVPETEDDYVATIAKQISEGDEIFNRNLDGRWIMAQMLQMLRNGYTESINNMGYVYQWNMLLDMTTRKDGELIRILRRIENNENSRHIDVKKHWFNGELIGDMIDDYADKLKEYIDSKPTFEFKELVPYKRLGSKYTKLTHHLHGDICVSDIPKLINTYRAFARRARYYTNYRSLIRLVSEFYDAMVKLPKSTKLSAKFVDAYKANGAYFTMNNMIRFHSCRLYEHNNGWERQLPKEESLNCIYVYAMEYDGYRSLGLLKEMIDDCRRFKCGDLEL